LRTTIKVFLRTEEKKREAVRLKEAKDTPPATPVEQSEPTLATGRTPLSPVVNDVAAREVKFEPSSAADITEEAPANPEEATLLQDAQQDIPQPSIEV
jgi:hypothetical protein